MNRALFELERKIDFKKLESISIDWNDNYEFKLKVKSWKLKESASHNPVLPIKPTFVIKWDEKILEIWAASIIAKVFRDKLISQYSLLYPDLGIEKHKWYGTKKHKEHLTNKSKITWIHRLSYKPVKEILEK
jgi:ribonuclease HII